MSMNRTVAQVRITRELQEAEASLNEALLRQSALFSTLVSARRDVGAAPFQGQEILMRLVRSQQSLLGAGGDLARVHRGLLQIAREESGVAGSAESMRIEECPPPAGQLSEKAQLHVA